MSESIITLKDINKFYGSGSSKQQVLYDINFSIRKGEFISLVGTSGSGKTTLLNIIGGLDRRYKGSCVVSGNQIETLSEKKLSHFRNSTIGFVFQSFNLMEYLTCWENVALSSYFDGSRIPIGQERERAKQVLERVGLKDKLDITPSNLSGGQKQRVAVARALFNKPKILLCDEPTGNLDSKTGEEVIDLFRELNKEDNITLLIITHEDRISKVANKSIHIEDGKIISLDAKNAPVKTV